MSEKGFFSRKRRFNFHESIGRERLIKRQKLKKDYDGLFKKSTFVDKRRSQKRVYDDDIFEKVPLTHDGVSLNKTKLPDQDGETKFIQINLMDTVESHFGGFEEEQKENNNDSKYMSSHEVMKQISERAEQHDSEVKELTELSSAVDKDWDHLKSFLVAKNMINAPSSAPKAESAKKYIELYHSLSTNEKVTLVKRVTSAKPVVSTKDPNFIENKEDRTGPFVDSLSVTIVPKFEKPSYLQDLDALYASEEITQPNNSNSNDDDTSASFTEMNHSDDNHRFHDEEADINVQPYGVWKFDKSGDTKYIKADDPKYLPMVVRLPTTLQELSSLYQNKFANFDFEEFIKYLTKFHNIGEREIYINFTKLLIRFFFEISADFDENILQENRRFLHILCIRFPEEATSSVVETIQNLSKIVHQMKKVELVDIATLKSICFGLKVVSSIFLSEDVSFVNLLLCLQMMKLVYRSESLNNISLFLIGIILEIPLLCKSFIPHLDCFLSVILKNLVLPYKKKECVPEDPSIFIKFICTLKEMIKKYKGTVYLKRMFSSVIRILNIVIKWKRLPQEVKSNIKEIVELYENSEIPTFAGSRTLLIKPTKSIKTFEPECQYGNPKDFEIRQMEQTARLKKSYKSELRGAKKELRRDSQYMAQLKIDKTVASDTIRKDKVKQLMKELALEDRPDKKFS